MASSACRKVIVDCDPGVDDTQAIMMLLAQKHIRVVAITTVFGNERLEGASRNVVRLLKYCGRLDIPVYRGCALPLVVDWPQKYAYDSVGKVVIPGVDPVDTSCIQPEHASVALCRLVSEDPGGVTLLALAPLTNIAVALTLDPSFGSKLKDCVMMGGDYTGRGNFTATAEYNWHCDPEAAHAVLAGLNKTITLLPDESCKESSMSWEWYDKIMELPCRGAELFKIINQYTRRHGHRQKYLTWDQVAAACLIDPSVICETKKVCASVELHISETRGQMVVLENTEGKTENVSIVTSVNHELYEKLITAAFTFL